MSINSLNKFAVAKINTIDNTCEILKVFLTKKDALEFMNSTVDLDEEYLDTRWYKKEHENTNTISVYQLHMFARKSLVCKYFLQEYEDTPLFESYSEYD